MPQPPTRASRARTRGVSPCAVTVGAAVGISIPPAGAAKKPKSVVTMTAGDVTVYKVGNDARHMPDDVRDKVMATITAYVTAATVKPLEQGAVDNNGLATALDPAVAARDSRTGPRCPRRRRPAERTDTRVVVTGAPVTMSGLADRASSVVVVTATIDTTATTKSAKGAINIKRTGDLVLRPNDDTWKIDGYDAHRRPERQGRRPTTTTTVPIAPAAARPPERPPSERSRSFASSSPFRWPGCCSPEP